MSAFIFLGVLTVTTFLAILVSTRISDSKKSILTAIVASVVVILILYLSYDFSYNSLDLGALVDFVGESFFPFLLGVSIFFLFICLITYYRRVIEETIQSKAADNNRSTWQTEDIPSNRASTIIDYENRADTLNRRANRVLIIIVCVLVASAIFIVFAGVIARLGASQTDVLNSAREDRSRLVRDLGRQQTELSELEAQLSIGEKLLEFFEENKNALDLTELSEVHNFYELLGQKKKVSRNQLSIIITRLKKRIERKNDTINSLIERLNSAKSNVEELYSQSMKNLRDREKGIEARTADDVAALLVAEAVTRFGVLAIAIYLVQILINLYQYNTRLAAYYLAQKDALVLYDHSSSDIAKLHKQLWPDLQYGKQPRQIPQKVVDRMGRIAEKALKREEGRLKQE